MCNRQVKIGDVYAWCDNPTSSYCLVLGLYKDRPEFIGDWSALTEPLGLSTEILGKYSHMIDVRILFQRDLIYVGNIGKLSENIKEMLFSSDLDTRKYAYEIIKANNVKK